MAQIQGLSKLVEQLRARAARALADSKVSVSVGYSQGYSLHVHENLQAVHPVGQAKFLEQPAREGTNSGLFSGIITKALRGGQTMAQALLLAGLRLQRDSQKLCPVDTGALRNSAFTRLDAAGGAVPNPGGKGDIGVKGEREG